MKKSIRLPIIWIIIFILIGASASFTLGASSMTAEQYYKNSTPIPEILENNIKKMKKANSYGPDFVVEYITTTGKEADVVSTLAEIQTLSDTLSQGLTDDYDKINAFADYVSENIYYDFDAAHNSVTFDVICLQNVLERKRTTCAGYSNLFSALCNAQGIYCVNIRGASPGDGITRKTLDSESAATNHEWTAAYYEKESRWVYVDNTWNSNNSYKNGKFNYYAGTKRFFDISLELLSIEHKARIVDYRNFFEALTLYEVETKPNTQTKVPNTTSTDKPFESTNKPDNSSSQNQSPTNESKTDETSEKSDTETIESDSTETNESDTDTSKATKKTTKKVDDSSSKLDNVESITTEVDSEDDTSDETKSNGLIVVLVVVGALGASVGGYFIFRKFKK